MQVDGLSITDGNYIDNSDIFFKATFSDDGRWVATIDPRDIFSDWVSGSALSISPGDLINSVFDYETELFSIFADSSYTLGNTAILSVFRDDSENWQNVYINFTNTDKFLFPSSEKARMYGIVDENTYDVFVAQDRFSTRNTTSSTRYRIFNASGLQHTTTLYANPYHAIRLVNEMGANGHNFTVRQSDNGAIVFLKDTRVTIPADQYRFFRFQFTKFYHERQPLDPDTIWWTRNYSNAHVVRSDGIFASDTVRTDNQPY